MSTLIVLLPLLPLESLGAATPYDYVLSDDDRTPTQHDRAAASLLPGGARGATELVAVVPAQALSWHRLTLPKGSLGRATLGGRRGGNAGGNGTPRLRAVLDGLLEERLLEEPSELHFAVQPDAADGAAVWVAACQRDWLRAALAPFEAVKRPVTRIVPEFAPMAEDAAGALPPLYIMGSPTSPQIASVTPQGVSLLPFNAGTLALALAQRQVAGNAAALPGEAVPIVAEPAVAQLAEAVAGHPVTLGTPTQRFLDAAHSRWDLAQFEFSSSGRSRAFKQAGQQAGFLWHAPQWRAARWGAGVLVAAQVVGLNAWAWKESSSLEQQRAQIRNTLTQTFPNVRVVVDAPVQMERELVNLRQAAGAASGRDLESMLGALADATPPGLVLTGVEFSNGEARIRGLADQGREMAGPLAGRGYAARVDGDQLVVQTASPVAAATAAVTLPSTVPMTLPSATRSLP
jgi:general secretion pathway protein L